MSNSVPLTVDQKAMFTELGIERDNTDAQDTRELISILTEYLHYPSDRLAKIHREACRLGMDDEIEKRKKMKQEFKTTGSSFSICQCCCCIQQEPLPFMTEVSDIETVNQSITLFFSDIKYIAVWCMMSFLLFGIFGIVTNVMSYNGYPEANISDCLRSRCVLHLMSLGSKLAFNETKRAETLYQYQTWMRLGLVLIWTIFFIFKLKSQRSIGVQQELRNVTAADFTILIKDLPSIYDKELLQQKLDQYANNVSYQIDGRFLQEGDKYDMKLTIVGYNQPPPYYQMTVSMEKAKQLQSKQYIEERLSYLKQWICFRQNNMEFPLQKSERYSVYNQIDAKNLQFIEEIRDLQKDGEDNMKQVQHENRTKCVLVTFHHNYAMKNMVKLNFLPWYLRMFKSCRDVPFTLNIPKIAVEPAPQPQDIIWGNIGVPLKSRILRSFCTYLVTFLILGFSFVVLYILSLFQIFSDAWQMSIVISLFVTIINQLILTVIYCLSTYERNQTHTAFEVSVAHKAIIAQLINSVVLYILVNILTKVNFGKGGLAEDVFFLSLTSGLVSPITRALGAGDIWRFVLRKWYSFSRNKLQFKSQRQYNVVWEKAPYDIGYNYVYVVKTIIFTAFFLSLQPIISLISCIGLIMMYYAQKYTLYYRASRPRPRSIYINAQMNAVMRLSIVSFALGNLFFSHFIPQSYEQPKNDLQDLVGLSIGLILYLVPLTMILQKYQQIPQPVGLLYQNQKIFLTSEYDRVNPATREEGIRNYGAFINELRLKYHKNNKSFAQMISYVVDQNKANPIQTVVKIGASLKAHRSKDSRMRKMSTFSRISQEPKQKQMMDHDSDASSIVSKSPAVSLYKNNNLQAPASDAIKMSGLREQSFSNQNSILNDLIKPKQLQKSQVIPQKSTFNIMDLINNILQIPDEQEQLSLHREYSSPVKSRQSIDIDKFLNEYVPKRSMDIPFIKKQSLEGTKFQN